jgi:hypothetical protein
MRYEEVDGDEQWSGGRQDCQRGNRRSDADRLVDVVHIYSLCGPFADGQFLANPEHQINDFPEEMDDPKRPEYQDQ